MDLSVPVPEDLARDPDKPFGGPRFRHPSLGLVNYREHFSYDGAAQVLHISMYFTPASNPARARMMPLTHRQFFPREWEALLHYNGFAVDQLYGDFDKSAFTSESDTMIWIVKKARSVRPPHAPPKGRGG
jgi:hypothetical protein